MADYQKGFSRMNNSIRSLLSTMTLLPALGLPLAALEQSVSLAVSDAGGQPGLSSPERGDMVVALDPDQYQGLVLAQGRRGKPELRLAPNVNQWGPQTDLVLHFDSLEELTRLGLGPYFDPERSQARYRLAGGSLPRIEKLSRYGIGSACFGPESGGLVLEDSGHGLFESGTFLGDFSISFWLYTANSRDGEVILEWQGHTLLQGKDTPQSFRVMVNNNQLIWQFNRIFGDWSGLGKILDSVVLDRSREILDHTWQHHLLRFKSRSGVLEYLVDGQVEDVRQLRGPQSTGSSVYQGWIGEESKSRLVLGKTYSGLLDELEITRQRQGDPGLENHGSGPAWVVLQPLNFREIGAGSKVLRIETQDRQPGNTDLAYYYWMSNSPGRPGRSHKAWVRFEPGKEIRDMTRGQYLFIKVEFLGDGTGMDSPGFQGVTVVYRADPPPPAPGGLIALPGDGTITLRWNPVSDPDIRGYLVYYGTRPGEYFGEEGQDPQSGVILVSPVQVEGATELVISGLENGRIYYFRVASYDTSNHPDMGLERDRRMSKEASARPAP